mmetsp:Transcript_85785/g.275872  ORF Transcript_85785/g.275872 Transcript_85785/m.275872 type:complete len:467 (+) Transcript_85785:64-1464(+)
MAPKSSLFGQRRVIYVTLAGYCIVATVYCLAKELYGPFLRTLVHCDTPVDPAEPFSGSEFCGDAKYVLASAQAQEGALVSAKLFVHGLAAPFLGSMTDTIGRKAMLMFSLAGFTCPIAFFMMISATGVTNPHVLLFCFLLAGATNAFDVVFFALLADLTPDMTDRSAALALYGFCNSTTAMFAQLVAIGILRLELRSYTFVWPFLIAVLALDMVYCQRAITETLVVKDHMAGVTLRRKLHNIVTAPIFLATSTPFIKWSIIGSVIGGIAGSGMGPCMNAFTMTAYGWRAGDAQLYTWPARPLDLALMVLAPFTIGWLSSPTAFLIGVVCGQILGFLRIFCPFSWVFFVMGSYVGPFLRIPGASAAGFTSSLVAPEKQATFNAVGHLIGNVCTSISTYLYSSPLLFRPEATGWAATKPFIICWAAGLVSLSISLRFTLPLVREGWRQKPASSKEEAEALRSSELHEV